MYPPFFEVKIKVNIEKNNGKRNCIKQVKKKTIILIHGFYATSGYWLQYLNYFKNYKIILLEIDYIELLSSKKNLFETKLFFSKYRYNEDVVGVVSHSLGTIISEFIVTHASTIKFEICPVAFAKRVSSVNFISDLESRIKDPSELISINLEKVDNFIKDSKLYLSDANLKFVPDNDDYFNYNVSNSYLVKFSGNHFEIGFALNIILSKFI